MLLVGSLALSRGSQVTYKASRVIECPGGSFPGTTVVGTAQATDLDGSLRGREVYFLKVASPQRVELRLQTDDSCGDATLRVYSVMPGGYGATTNGVELGPQLKDGGKGEDDGHGGTLFFSRSFFAGLYGVVVELGSLGQTRSYNLVASFLGSYSSYVNASALRLESRKLSGSSGFDPAVDDIQSAVDAWVSDRSAAEAKYGHISMWNTNGITSMRFLFTEKSSFNDDISGWDTSSVRDMSWMFSGAAAFNQNISAWDTSSATNLQHMFRGAYAFDQDISSWNTSSVTKLGAMFAAAESFNQDIGAWDTSSVTDMDFLFHGARAFNQDISLWDTGSVTDMKWMFARAHAFNQDISAWDTSSVTDMGRMFYDAISFNQNISTWNTSRVTDMSYMFNDADAFNQDISPWDTSRVTDMTLMFISASSFNQTICWDLSSLVFPSRPSEVADGSNGQVLDSSCGSCPCDGGGSSGDDSSAGGSPAVLAASVVASVLVVTGALLVVLWLRQKRQALPAVAVPVAEEASNTATVSSVQIVIATPASVSDGVLVATATEVRQDLQEC
eukprot:scaffold384_cov238-Pinguiococcus_pyrenoidosus.AAC.2